jgi:hypothetical protein
LPQLQRSAATLRINGDGVVPDEISRVIGSEPSHSHRKGEGFGGPSGSTNRRKSGHWSLEATDRSPENVNGQIAEILGRLTDDLAVWANLAANYQVDLFCGWFMAGSDEGLDILPENLAALGARGIKLSVCLYAPLED